MEKSFNDTRLGINFKRKQSHFHLVQNLLSLFLIPYRIRNGQMYSGKA